PDDIAEVNAQMESWHNAISNEHLCKAFQHLPGFDAEAFIQALEEDAMKDGDKEGGSLNYNLFVLLYRAGGLIRAKEIEHGSHDYYREVA
ncbi:hypothetical protein I2492_19395, partial [Budviciaceae bacterium CWB-B4]